MALVTATKEEQDNRATVGFGEGTQLAFDIAQAKWGRRLPDYKRGSVGARRGNIPGQRRAKAQGEQTVERCIESATK